MAPLRYVVLSHEGIADPHFDLMFETAPGSALKTWRSPVWPIKEPTALVELGNHRRAYLEYEGPVSDNRGNVLRICGGQISVVFEDNANWRISFDDSALELLLTKTGESWFVRPISVQNQA